MIIFSLASRYIPELDGIRAIAILMVLAGHMHTELWKFRGELGVVLFFVLSGYLITSIALREEADTGGVSLSAFYIRRTFRIFPLYYLALAVHCLLIFGLGIGPEKRGPFLAAMPYYLTYFQEVFVLGKRLPDLPFAQSWTLGIEEKFYIIWPFLAFVVLRFRRNLRLPAALGLAFAVLFGGQFLQPYASILAGCALALTLGLPAVRGAVARVGSVSVWLSVAAMCYLHVIGAPGPPVILNPVYTLAATCLIASLLLVRTPVNTLLAWRPLVAIGKVSYGIYLIHRICLNVAEHAMHGRFLPSLLGAIVLSFAVAWFLHISIEKPLISVGRKLAAAHQHASHQRGAIKAACV